MAGVTEIKDKAEPLVVGKFLKQDRIFPKKFWPPADEPKFHLPSQRANKVIEQLVPGLKSTSASLSDLDLQLQEAQLRELITAISQLRWLLDAQKSMMAFSAIQGSFYADAATTINLAMDWFIPFLLDSLSVMLTNTVLTPISLKRFR